MRSADFRRWVLCTAGVAVGALVLSGCSMLPGKGKPEITAAAPAAAASAPVVAATEPEGPSAAERAAAILAREQAEKAEAKQAAAKPAPKPIDAATQRAFDEAVALLRAGRSAEAERALRALLTAQPELAGVHANLGLLHRRAGRHDEAVAALQEAVRLSPEQPLFHNQLGVALRQAGQFVKAREAYEAAIRLDAGYAAPQLNLAILLDLYLGDRGRAAEWYQRSAVLLPGDAPQINRWLADLKNRKPEASVATAAAVASSTTAGAAAATAASAARKEKE
jgi:Flp pilus assembly protein TadD